MARKRNNEDQIQIDFTSDTSGLEKGTKRAKKSIEQVAESTNKFNKALGNTDAVSKKVTKQAESIAKANDKVSKSFQKYCDKVAQANKQSIKFGEYEAGYQRTLRRITGGYQKEREASTLGKQWYFTKQGIRNKYSFSGGFGGYLSSGFAGLLPGQKGDFTIVDQGEAVNDTVRAWRKVEDVTRDIIPYYREMVLYTEQALGNVRRMGMGGNSTPLLGTGSTLSNDYAKRGGWSQKGFKETIIGEFKDITPEKFNLRSFASSALEEVQTRLQSIRRSIFEVAQGGYRLLSRFDDMLQPLIRATGIVFRLVQNLYNIAKPIVKATGAALKLGYAFSKLTLTGAVKGLKSIGTGAIQANKGLLNMGKSLIGGIKNLRRMGKECTYTKLNLKALLHMFKSIVLYRVFRTIIHSITTAFSEGTKNVYNWSKLMNGQVYQSINKIATSMLYLQNSIGAVVAPLANYFAPVIDSIVDKIVELINYLNQLISKLMGASTWTKAIKVQTEWKDALDKSAKSAKQLTIGIDELNVLSDNNSSDTDYGSMFKNEELPLTGFDWIDRIKEMIKNGDYSGIGKELGNAFNQLVEYVSPKLENLGKQIAERINNSVAMGLAFFDTADFEKLGSTLANALNRVVTTLDWSKLGQFLGEGWMTSFRIMRGFIDEFDWATLGDRLANMVNGIASRVDLKYVSTTFANALNGIFTTIHVFLAKLDKELIAYDISGTVNGLFMNIDTDRIGSTIGQAFNTISSIFNKAVAQIKWTDIGANVQKGVNSLFEKINARDVGDVISGTWNGIMDFFVGFVSKDEGLRWKTIGTKVGDFLNGVFVDFKWGELGNLVADSFNGVLTMLETASDKFEWDTFSTQLGTLINNMVTNIKWNQIGGALSRQVQKLFVFVRKFVGTIDWESMGIKVGEMINGIDWYNIITEAWNTVKELCQALLDAIKGILISVDWEQKLYDICYALIDGLFPNEDSMRKEMEDGAKSFASALGDAIKGAVKGIGKGIWAAIKEDLANSNTTGGTFFGMDVEITKGGLSFTPKANGGYLDTGEAFIARESGPELVGRIGNRTAVANNDQIVDAVSSGVYEAVLAAMSGKSNGTTSVNVYLDGKQITSAVEKRQRQRGASIYSGGLIYEG